MAKKSTQGEDHKDHGVLYVGIDLGTSRTSVAASNGVRETLPSFVGYPKDVVSKKLLKKDVLFGDEAISKRLSLNLFRPSSTECSNVVKAGMTMLRATCVLPVTSFWRRCA